MTTTQDCPRHGASKMLSDGSFRWCDECAWEDPNNPADAAPPVPKEREMEPHQASANSIGTKQLAEMCRNRIGELDRELAKHNRAIVAGKTEVSRLRKIIALCEGGATSGTAAKSHACDQCSKAFANANGLLIHKGRAHAESKAAS